MWESSHKIGPCGAFLACARLFLLLIFVTCTRYGYFAERYPSPEYFDSYSMVLSIWNFMIVGLEGDNVTRFLEMVVAMLHAITDIPASSPRLRARGLPRRWVFFFWTLSSALAAGIAAVPVDPSRCR